MLPLALAAGATIGQLALDQGKRTRVFVNREQDGDGH